MHAIHFLVRRPAASADGRARRHARWVEPGWRECICRSPRWFLIRRLVGRGSGADRLGDGPCAGACQEEEERRRAEVARKNAEAEAKEAEQRHLAWLAALAAAAAAAAAAKAAKDEAGGEWPSETRFTEIQSPQAGTSGQSPPFDLAKWKQQENTSAPSGTGPVTREHMTRPPARTAMRTIPPSIYGRPYRGPIPSDMHALRDHVPSHVVDRARLSVGTWEAGLITNIFGIFSRPPTPPDAVTLGRTIYVRDSGEFQPDLRGQALLVHELTHVEQWGTWLWQQAWFALRYLAEAASKARQRIGTHDKEHGVWAEVEAYREKEVFEVTAGRHLPATEFRTLTAAAPAPSAPAATATPSQATLPENGPSPGTPPGTPQSE